MSGHFEPLPDGGAAVLLDEVEISILRSLAVQLMELIGPGEEAGESESDDLLASVFNDGPSEPPADPVLARFFPDAYGGPDLVPDDDVRAASAEFRRYTENDLRSRKREDALALIRALDTLAPEGGSAELRLKPDECRQWLGALNDLRLAIGTRLEVTDEEDGGELLRLPDSDPRKPMVMAYLWLGGLQETLVESLMG
ncbi:MULTISPECIES: DUF2017 domain-containing protein [Streptomyces]|uniref:DUF2017 domain-containing protein n=2 Tax=Streptomyces nigrescens TaxID=1920 RepID=A0A640TLQ2_STRNI|nr:MULTISPECIES: DUF2017 domain-containing protein [Streptomyces]MCW7987137.1 hypothetical protein [Streptomyces platensis subsp. clarensis]AWN27461.1 DUF2017 domain-containing protein [Streptomyces sp. NEAU-S7GS2]MCX5447110.1 DUF2017 domain-containing protein [Streptomyces libani]MYT13304.1 DUF2017 family protein [Streptomyces sp. SID4951]MYX10470.1 DUF2017 family protein [Streptomyces sp. SID8375]